MKIEWTEGPPPAPGTYLVRDGDTNTLITLLGLKAIPEGLPDWCAAITWHCRLEIPEPPKMPPPGLYAVRYTGQILTRRIDSDGVVSDPAKVWGTSSEPWTAYEWGPRLPEEWGEWG